MMLEERVKRPRNTSKNKEGIFILDRRTTDDLLQIQFKISRTGSITFKEYSELSQKSSKWIGCPVLGFLTARVRNMNSVSSQVSSEDKEMMDFKVTTKRSTIVSKGIDSRTLSSLKHS
jgi:hypothetical protein